MKNLTRRGFLGALSALFGWAAIPSKLAPVVVPTCWEVYPYNPNKPTTRDPRKLVGRVYPSGDGYNVLPVQNTRPSWYECIPVKGNDGIKGELNFVMVRAEPGNPLRVQALRSTIDVRENGEWVRKLGNWDLVSYGLPNRRYPIDKTKLDYDILYGSETLAKNRTHTGR